MGGRGRTTCSNFSENLANTHNGVYANVWMVERNSMGFADFKLVAALLRDN
jgi:hypothetical protein